MIGQIPNSQGFQYRVLKAASAGVDLVSHDDNMGACLISTESHQLKIKINLHFSNYIVHSCPYKRDNLFRKWFSETSEQH